MEDTTVVYVYNEKRRAFVPTPANQIRCPECGKTYVDMVWDDTAWGEGFVQCPCGEQFFTTEEV